MCARFTVLSDTPIAAAIAGCVIPLSRNSTIWMRWRCGADIFHRNAVFSRRTSALLHLTICFPPNQMAQANHTSGEENTRQTTRFKPLWRWYEIADSRMDCLGLVRTGNSITTVPLVWASLTE